MRQDEKPPQGLSPKPMLWHCMVDVQLAEPIIAWISASSLDMFCCMGSGFELEAQLDKKLAISKEIIILTRDSAFIGFP